VLSAATSGNWAWLLPVPATVLNSHFKSSPVWGLRRTSLVDFTPQEYCLVQSMEVFEDGFEQKRHEKHSSV
jgi:hypothetical protein